MKRCVLIAGRDDQSRGQLIALLSGEHIDIHAVCDEEDLFLEVLERDFDLIVYDLSESLLNGLKVVKILRRMRPKWPLLVISDNPSREVGGRILQEGVSYFGIKPVNPEAIQKTLSTVLSEDSGREA